MRSYRYVIVGGGMTADAAAKGIRERDADGTIALVGDEAHPPYNRPPLTKGCDPAPRRARSGVAPTRPATCCWAAGSSRRARPGGGHGHRRPRHRAERAGEPYDHLPFFYSDLFDLGYEAVGGVDSRCFTLAHWVEPGRKGVVAYLDDGRRPRGILLWGIFGRVDAARELIRARHAIDEDALGALAG